MVHHHGIGKYRAQWTEQDHDTGQGLPGLTVAALDELRSATAELG